MTNVSFSRSSFDAAAPLMCMTLAAPIDDHPSSIEDQVSNVVFSVIAGIAAAYLYKGLTRLPQAIESGAGMMIDGISIPVRGFHYLRDSWRGENVFLAVAKGKLELVRALLASGQILNADRGLAVIHAMRYGRYSKIGFLPLNPDFKQMIILLLQSGQISESHRGMAVEKGAAHNDVEMVKSLLKGPFPGAGSISLHYREKAIIQAARRGCLDALTFFLDQRYSISGEIRGQAAVIACSSSNKEMLTLLLASGPISFTIDAYRGDYALYAAQNGCEELLKLILVSGPLNQSDLHQAVSEAAVKGHTQCVRLLLSYGLISEQVRIMLYGLTQFQEVKRLLESEQSCQRLFMEGQRDRIDQNLALNHIQQNAGSFRLAIPEFRNNIDFLLAAAARNGLILRFIPESQITIEIVVAALSQNPEAKEWVPESVIAQSSAKIDTTPSLLPLLREEEITPARAERAIAINPLFLKFISPEIQSRLNDGVLTSALGINPTALEFIDQFLLKIEVVHSVLAMNLAPKTEDFVRARDAALRKLADKVLNKIIESSIASSWICELAEYFDDDKEFMLFAITNYGVSLNVASSRLRDDDDLVLAAVTTDKDDLRYASDRLKLNPTPALRAVLLLTRNSVKA